MHLEEKVEALKEHPVEAGEVEEVGEGEGGAEERLDEPQRHQVLPREGEDPVECGETKSAEQPHVDLVTQAPHFPSGGGHHLSCQANGDICSSHFLDNHVAQHNFIHPQNLSKKTFLFSSNLNYSDYAIEE